MKNVSIKMAKILNKCGELSNIMGDLKVFRTEENAAYRSSQWNSVYNTGHYRWCCGNGRKIYGYGNTYKKEFWYDKDNIKIYRFFYILNTMSFDVNWVDKVCLISFRM